MLVVLLAAISVPVAAQNRHAVSSATLASEVRQHVADQDVDRALIRKSLELDEVRDAAASVGIDLQQLAASANSATGADLARATQIVRQMTPSGPTSLPPKSIIIPLLLVLALVLVLVNAPHG
jgi:hypothetical protein